MFNAGSTIQWLRDELGLISSAPECDRLAESVPDAGGVYVVPAFTGLGAPYWDMYARGTIVGLTRGTTKAHIARAVLDAIAFQVTDLVQAMNADAPCPITTLRVDGGASVSDIMMQTQADLLRLPVDRPAQVETGRSVGQSGGSGCPAPQPARISAPAAPGRLRGPVPPVAPGSGPGVAVD